MRKSGKRNESLSTIPQFRNSIVCLCGNAVYKPRVSLGLVSDFIHMVDVNRVRSVQKSSQKPRLFTQPNQFLCTVFLQFYNTLQSVNASLVHTIHSAYKYVSNSQKGVF